VQTLERNPPQCNAAKNVDVNAMESELLATGCDDGQLYVKLCGGAGALHRVTGDKLSRERKRGMSAYFPLPLEGEVDPRSGSGEGFFFFYLDRLTYFL
jgi:hypothetical protein